MRLGAGGVGHVGGRLRLEVVQRERRRGPPGGCRGRRVPDERRPYQTLALVRADLSGQLLVGKLDVLFSEHAQELVHVQVEQAELRVGVARQMEHHQSVAVADDALDAEVVDGGHLRRDVVVLEVLRHLGEAAAPAEAEERTPGGGESGEGRGGGAPCAPAPAAAVMHVDDSLTTHAEREATVLVQHAVTRQRTLREPSRFCTRHTYTHASIRTLPRQNSSDDIDTRSTAIFQHNPGKPLPE